MFWVYLTSLLCPLLFINKKVYFYSFYLSLFFFSAFRYSVGSDYSEYLVLFEHVLELKDVPVEYSFVALSSFFQNLGLNSQSIFFSYALLTFYFIYKAGLLFNDDDFLIVLVLCLFIFFYFPSLSVMRQALSCSILFYSTLRYFIKDQSFFVFLCYSILAVFFHHPSFFFLIVFCLCRFKLRADILSLLSVVLFVFFAFVPQDYVLYFFDFFSLDYKNHLSKNIGTPSLFFVVYSFGLLVFYCVGNYCIAKRDKSYLSGFVSNIVFVLLVFRFLSFKVLVFGRLAIYFNLFLIVYFYFSFFVNFNLLYKKIAIGFLFVFGVMNSILVSSKDIYYENYIINFSMIGETNPYVIIGNSY